MNASYLKKESIVENYDSIFKYVYVLSMCWGTYKNITVVE